METTPWAAIYIDKCARPSMYPVTLRCERSEPRRATAPAPRPSPSRAASRPPQDDGTCAASLLPVTIGALPAVLGNIENDAVGVLELALEIAMTFVAEIEEEFAAGRLNFLLSFDEVVDLEAEMVRADKTLGIFQVRGRRAG